MIKPTTPLKPCPFCGGEAVQASTRFGYPAEHWVKCGYCQSSTTAYAIREAAITAWNTRHAANCHEPLVEALERAEKALERYGSIGTLIEVRAALSLAQGEKA